MNIGFILPLFNIYSTSLRYKHFHQYFVFKSLRVIRSTTKYSFNTTFFGGKVLIPFLQTEIVLIFHLLRTPTSVTVTHQGLQLDKQQAKQAHCYVLSGSNTSGSAIGQATSKIHNHTVMFCLPVTYQGLQLDKQQAKQAHCYVLPGSNISGPATGQATSKTSTLLRFAWQ